MAVQPWRAILLLVGGVGVGVAIAGLPSQRSDPPLRVRADSATSSSTTAPMITPTTSATTSEVPASTTTTRRRTP